MKNKHRISIKKSFYALIILFSVLMGVCIFTDTFALFETKGSGQIEQSVGKWLIKVNGNDITKANDIKFTVDTFNYTENNNVVDGKIAPGRSGYFDITIDPEGTDVSVKYDVEFDFSSSASLTSTVTDLTGGNVVKTGNNKYSGIIKLSEIKKGTTNTIRVNIDWQNNEDNNDQDSTIGSTPNNSISIPVTVTATQYTGETLVPYE